MILIGMFLIQKTFSYEIENHRPECNPHENGMKIKKSNTGESTVERRFMRRRYRRKVSLREYSRATDHFDYVLES